MERFGVTFLLLLNLIGGISSRILMPRSTNEGKLEKEPSSFFLHLCPSILRGNNVRAAFKWIKNFATFSMQFVLMLQPYSSNELIFTLKKEKNSVEKEA